MEWNTRISNNSIDKVEMKAIDLNSLKNNKNKNNTISELTHALDLDLYKAVVANVRNCFLTLATMLMLNIG